MNIKSDKDHDYIDYYHEGRREIPGTKCPYGMRDMGKRCAWLAGILERHGYDAWEMARQ